MIMDVKENTNNTISHVTERKQTSKCKKLNIHGV